MKFNFEEWKDKKVVMHCSTREEAEDFCRVMHEAGKKWDSGREYISVTHWSNNKENICYNFNTNSYYYRDFYIENGYIILEWSEYMEKTFTKSDLKNGDVIVDREGRINIVCVETKTCITPTGGFNRLEDIEDDLTNLNGQRFDIVDVYRPTEPNQCCFSKEAYNGVHVFHRDEEPVEVTLEEIAKLKGVSVDRIRIVKERN